MQGAVWVPPTQLPFFLEPALQASAQQAISQATEEHAGMVAQAVTQAAAAQAQFRAAASSAQAQVRL